MSSHKKGTAPGKKKQTSFRSHRNGTVPEKTNVISQERDCSKPNRLLCHLTRKGPLLKKTNCCVISQERDCLSNRQRPKQNCRNRSQNASGSLEPCHNMWHGFATRDSDRRVFCISPSVVKQCFKKDIQTFFLLPWRLDPFCTMGDDPRQARSCSSEFCP